jgi:2-octaprenyl-6-methoxyphenol hydroxylase
MTEVHDYDVLIVGGGLVGASLACALGGQPLRVGIIEAHSFDADTQPSYDDRTVAIAYGARRIFEGMDLWASLAVDATPIERIHVSDRGHFGVTRLAASDTKYEALGYIIENRILGRNFARAIPSYSNLELLCPAQLQAIRIDNTAAWADIRQDESTSTLSARLIIGADGGQSLVRRCMGIEAATREYGQTAIIANVTPGNQHRNTAFERFTEHGPLAMLPMSHNRCSLVWTMDSNASAGVLELNDETFLDSLQRCFGYRLGRLERTGIRRAYPLTLLRAQQHIAPRLALIGNAAHTLHPVAGQGFNLGLRDVAVMAQILLEAISDGKDPGDLAVLDRYRAWRRRDQAAVMAFTDGIVRVFSNALLPLVVARNIGLIAMDVLPPLKHGLLRRTMGLSGRLPRLGRAMTLQTIQDRQ